MALYGLVNAVNEIQRYQEFDGAPPVLAAAKGLRWLPVIDTKPTPGEGEVLTGPVEAVTTDAITRVWTAVPYVAPVPPAVSAFQARAVLHRNGLLEQVEAIIAASEDQEAKLAWAHAVEFIRTGPLLNGVAAQLGLTSAQIDDLFRAAALIEA